LIAVLLGFVMSGDQPQPPPPFHVDFAIHQTESCSGTIRWDRALT